MIRILILIGFTFVFMHLHATGDISKYINMKYAWISYSTIFLLWFITIAAFIFYMKGDEHDHNHGDGCDCHSHSHAPRKRDKFLYLIYIVPIITALFLPISKLDSKIVEAKGFNFPIYEKNSPYDQHQFLEPDTSSFYGEEAYDKMIRKDLKQFGKSEKLNLEDTEFLNAMETIYNYPGEFTGKTIRLKGFLYHNDELPKNQYFLFRFGIIHCIADSGAFGMLIEFPDDVSFQNDDWVTVTGKIDTMYYQPFKKTLPMIKVSNVKKEQEPDDPYVYRNNQ
ncbi:TIGR03943 family putative permease subunit [Priestia flexa]|uniref:TIGR03943 family putative permease subunit n=1 Tax=Priestia flexa TaxID=86664 RepID=UPI00288D15D0|nr:TIGR03943 family protein [Priestia flexa]MDT2047361.1 TIGR03943 family protein [Priestia flexa]